MGQRVPSVLLSGHHGNIEKWRRKQSLIRTYQRRPDLLDKARLSEEDREFLIQFISQDFREEEI